MYVTVYWREHVRARNCSLLSREKVGRRYSAREMIIGRVSLARENEAGGSWGQEIHILHVNI